MKLGSKKIFTGYYELNLNHLMELKPPVYVMAFGNWTLWR